MPPVPAVVVAVSQNMKSEFHAHAPTHSAESMIIQHCCGVVLPPTPVVVATVAAGVVVPPVPAVVVASSQKKKSEFHAHAPIQSSESLIIQHG